MVKTVSYNGTSYIISLVFYVARQPWFICVNRQERICLHIYEVLTISCGIYQCNFTVYGPDKKESNELGTDDEACVAFIDAAEKEMVLLNVYAFSWVLFWHVSPFISAIFPHLDHSENTSKVVWNPHEQNCSAMIILIFQQKRWY